MRGGGEEEGEGEGGPLQDSHIISSLELSDLCGDGKDERRHAGDDPQ